MRVVAFSDTHIATPDTQQWLFGGPVDYSHCYRFIEMMMSNPPDTLICVGDFCEESWDTPDMWQVLLPEFTGLDVLRLRGNHDPNSGAQNVEIDGVRYEHGRARPDTIEAVRRKYADQRVVHGHTHGPQQPWPLDLGSLVFTGTYGEILDGVACLRSVINGSS